MTKKKIRMERIAMLLYVKRGQKLPNSHTDIAALPGEAKVGCVVVEAASSGTGEKTEL